MTPIKEKIPETEHPPDLLVDQRITGKQKIREQTLDALECFATTQSHNNKRLRQGRQQLDLSPIVYITSNKIQNSYIKRSLIVMLDSGSTHTMIKKSCFPFGVETTKGTPKRTTNTNGNFSSSESVMLSQVKFPEFSNNNIGDIKADVFDSTKCRYELIIGWDVLERMGIILDFNKHQMTWTDKIIPMKSTTDIRHTETFIKDIEDHYNL